LPGFLVAGRKRIAILAAASMVLIVAQLAMLRGGHSYFSTTMLSRGMSSTQAAMPAFFAGRLWAYPIPFQALFAWMIKTPLSVLILASAGGTALWKSRARDPLLTSGATAFVVMILLTVLLRSRYVSTAHLFWFYAFACVAAGGVFTSSAATRWRRGAAALAVLLVGECFSVHPQHLAYFNFLAGGSSHGYFWLDDSDQDWGQGLPALAHWMRQNGISKILLSYSGAGDPRIYGIQYQDVLCPALVTREYRGEVLGRWPVPLYFALGTKVAQSEPLLMEWPLKHRRPVYQVGYTFLVYNLTGDREALGWLAWLYRATGRTQNTTPKAAKAPAVSISTSWIAPVRPATNVWWYSSVQA
jgi:hypothetical protein